MEYQGNDDSGFELEEEDQGSGGNYQLIATPGPVNSSGQDSTTEYGLTFDDTYLFRIRADHSDGTVSGYSSGQVTPTGLMAPTFSAGLTANPSDPRYPIHLDWAPSAGGDTSGVDYYVLEYQASDTAGPGRIPYGTQGGDQGDSESTDLNLADGATGSFRLQATYNDGYRSEWAYAGPVTQPLETNVVMVDPPGINPTVVSDTEIDLSWQTVQGQGVALTMGTLPGLDGEGNSGTISTWGMVNQNGTSTLALTGLTPGTEYFFAMTLTTETSDGILDISYGSASATTQSSTQPTTAPAAPGVFTATRAKGREGVNLHWTNNPPNEQGYIILRSDDDAPFQQIKSFGPDETKWFDDTTKPNHLYHYELVALSLFSVLPRARQQQGSMTAR